MKTMAELLQERDAANCAFHCYAMTDLYAYLGWPAAQQVEFHVSYRAAQDRLVQAEAAYADAVARAAMVAAGERKG